jgi:hypothetical protein
MPYPANQQKDIRGILRIDKKFRVHGPEKLRRLYRLRSSVERVNSRLQAAGQGNVQGLEGRRNAGFIRGSRNALRSMDGYKDREAARTARQKHNVLRLTLHTRILKGHTITIRSDHLHPLPQGTSLDTKKEKNSRQQRRQDKKQQR